MTEDERAATAWLRTTMWTAESLKHVSVIERLLAMPRLPEEPTPEMIGAMATARGTALGSWADVYRALYAECRHE